MTLTLDEERKAERTILVQMAKCGSEKEQRVLADYVGLPWDEYLRLKLKYAHLLTVWERNKAKPETD